MCDNGYLSIARIVCEFRLYILNLSRTVSDSRLTKMAL